MKAPPEIRRVAIVGAGNGGCAAAVDLTRRGFEVRLWGRSAATIAPLIAAGGIEHEGIFGEGKTRPAQITEDLPRALDGADLVLIMGPTHAHEDIAQALAPHVRPHQLVMAAPGHTLLLIPGTIGRLGGRFAAYCDTTTLPYICRKVSPSRVRVSRAAKALMFAAFPGEITPEAATRIRPVLPAIAPSPSLLHTVFLYMNAIHHPAALLLNIGRLESSGGDYCHYFDGITPSVGRLIDALDCERIAVASAFGVSIEKLPDYFFRIGYTTEEGRAGGAYGVFHHSEPNRWIKAPATVDHRFFNEDVPFGLVPLSELGRLAGVKAELVDAVVAVASAATGRDFRRDGLTLERMGIAGLSPKQLDGLLASGKA
ncbi:MAG TPA: NAD/NADP octopine/nopaline dehydrogenase family protein [Stellaceae bacterium]|nr:NAD/NADP octopine/nopaline dehydrogenase family protein [Stellaceae bacterium]